jgi:hypothetical protein
MGVDARLAGIPAPQRDFGIIAWLLKGGRGLVHHRLVPNRRRAAEDEPPPYESRVASGHVLRLRP